MIKRIEEVLSISLFPVENSLTILLDILPCYFSILISFFHLILLTAHLYPQTILFTSPNPTTTYLLLSQWNLTTFMATCRLAQKKEQGLQCLTMSFELRIWTLPKTKQLCKLFRSFYFWVSDTQAELDGTLLRKNVAAFRLYPYISQNGPEFQTLICGSGYSADPSQYTEKTSRGLYNFDQVFMACYALHLVFSSQCVHTGSTC